MVTMTMWLDVCRFSFSTLPVFNFGVLTLGFARCTGEIAKCSSIDIYILFFFCYVSYIFLGWTRHSFGVLSIQRRLQNHEGLLYNIHPQNSQNQVVKLLGFSSNRRPDWDGLCVNYDSFPTSLCVAVDHPPKAPQEVLTHMASSIAQAWMQRQLKPYLPVF